MCLAVPAKIIEIQGEKAVIDLEGVQRTVVISLLPDLQVGDHVIIHAGFAIQKWSNEDVAEWRGIMNEINGMDEKGHETKGPGTL